MVSGRTVSRAELRATTPAWYRWWLHAALIAAFSTTMFACALRQLEAPGLVDAAVFAAMLLFANLGEFAVHRRSLHVRHFPYAPYERHTSHHAFFTYDDMAVDELRDMRWVMFPPWALPMMLAAAMPFFALLRWTAPPNVAWLFLAAISLYYGIYEVLHSLAHLPAGNPLAGLAFVRAVTHHHRVHHDLRLMRRYNFNFALPLFDWLFGTLYRPPR